VDALFQTLFDADIYHTYSPSSVVDTLSSQFMTRLGDESGGTAVQFDFNAADMVWPRFGDHTEDGCVNDDDSVEMALWSPEGLESTHPMTHRLDVNRDGRLDGYDRLVSTGCGGP
jgi:hypothetical protein